MKKILVFLIALAILVIFQNAACADEAEPRNDDGWVRMPAGAKSAYMGIHGGTMPVSLFVGDGGSSLLAFAGRTGNDFLEVLRKIKLPLPSFGNATKPVGALEAQGKGQTGLFAGNATASLPVIPLSGNFFAREEWLESLEPFGFSATPLSIEGQAAKPDKLPMKKRARFMFQPGAFHLRGN